MAVVSQIWDRLKPEAQSSAQVSHVGGRGPAIWAVVYCLPRNISREMDGNGVARTGIGALA